MRRVEILPPPTPIEREQPIEAMMPCEQSLSELPAGFENLPVDKAIEILATNHVVDSTFYFECKRKQEDLTRWIGEG